MSDQLTAIPVNLSPSIDISVMPSFDGLPFSFFRQILNPDEFAY